MMHVTLVCDFCGDTVVNYDMHAGQETAFKGRVLFDQDACEECFHCARNVLFEAIRKIEKKKEE